MADIDNWIHTYPRGTMFYCENRKQASLYSTKKHGFHFYENLLEIDEAYRPTPILALVPVETITAYIVQVCLGDVPHGSLEYKTIFAAGITLFVFTFILNNISFFIRKKFREEYE